MNIFFAMLLFLSVSAEPIDLAMLDLDMEPDIRVTLNNPGAGGAPLTNYVLTEGSDNITDESGNKITKD